MTTDRYTKFQNKYRYDPIAFIHDCFQWENGEGPTFYQDEVIDGVVSNRRVSIRGPHGLGKTALSSWLVLWFALTRDQNSDWKVPTTAGAWTQLSRFLWPEIHKWAHMLRWNIIGRTPFVEGKELLQGSLNLSTGQAFGLASTNPQFIEGAHAECLMYIFDESKSIIDDTFNAAEGAFASPSTYEAYAFAPSTPGAPIGRFYEIHQRKPGYEDWRARHITLPETIRAKRVSPDWVEQRKIQWGENSAIYQNRVLGEFASESAVGIIPIAWVEAAVDRWLQWRDSEFRGHVTSIACDVSEGKSDSDESVIAIVYDHCRVEELRHYHILDPDIATMELVGVLSGLINKYPDAQVFVDCTGVGTGVLNRLRELRYRNVFGFVAAERTDLLDASGELGFANWRAAAWWMTREMCDPHNGIPIALPDDDALVGDFTIPQYSINSVGKYLIEKKDSLRKPTRLGRSTDCGDAVVMALIGPTLQAEKVRREFTEVNIRYEPVQIGRY